jgi:hypothetical protein
MQEHTTLPNTRSQRRLQTIEQEVAPDVFNPRSLLTAIGPPLAFDGHVSSRFMLADEL